VAERINALRDNNTLAIAATWVSPNVSEFSRGDGLPLVDWAA
jgi:hypothetical protein